MNLFLLSEGMNQVVMLVLMFVVLYFFMIRPQVKKQKKEKNFQGELKKGDRVVTTSGMHGKIAELNDMTCVVDTGAGKIKFDRTAISNELTAASYSPKKEDK